MAGPRLKEHHKEMKIRNISHLRKLPIAINERRNQKSKTLNYLNNKKELTNEHIVSSILYSFLIALSFPLLSRRFFFKCLTAFSAWATISLHRTDEYEISSVVGTTLGREKK